MNYSLPYVFGRTLRGESFGAFISPALTVGLFTAIQLWNGGTKNAMVTSMCVSSLSVTILTATAYTQNTALGGTTQLPVNKLAGSTATSTLTIYTGTMTTLPTTARVLGSPISSAFAPTELMDEDDCICLPPGQGLTVVASVVALNMNVNAKWVEIPV
jgi:hypothetical protein